MVKGRAAYSMAVAILGMSLLGGCTSVEERKSAYRQAQMRPPLEVPPDLISPESFDTLDDSALLDSHAATFSEYQSETTSRQQGQAAQRPFTVGVPGGGKLSVGRDGAQRWLILPGGPERWWEPVQEFLRSQGFTIRRSSERLGLIETGFSSVAGYPPRNVLQKILAKWYDAGTRDQFVVFLEPGGQGATTEVFLSNRRLVNTADKGSPQWLPAAADRALEEEMLRRLALFISDGAAALEDVMARSDQATQVTLEAPDSDDPRLIVNRPFAETWRRVGKALTRSHFELDDHNRDKGVFFASGVIDESGGKRGLLSRLFSSERGRKLRFVVELTARGEQTEVHLTAADGESLNPEDKRIILTILRDQLS